MPALATLTPDFRDPDLARLEALRGAIAQRASEVAARREVTMTWQPDLLVELVPLDADIRA